MGALLALAMTTTLLTAPVSTSAQVNLPTGGTPNINLTNITPQNIATMAKQGLTTQATSALAAQAGIDPATANTIVSNIAQNGVSLQSATDLVGGMLGGQINGAVGEALSKIPGLGNININQIASQAISSGLQAALSGLNANQAVGQAAAALGILGGAGAQAQIAQMQQQLQQAGVSALTGAVADAISKMLPPELANLLGGAQGIAGVLSGLIGGGASVITGGSGNDPSPGGASCNCERDIANHHETIRAHMTNKRKEHELWLVTEFFTQHVAPALMLMAEQLTVAGMQQVQIIGSFFDAKHQLETQRLFQQLAAEAHKDYQPSEGLCTFGTAVRSLAASERAAHLAQEVVATRSMHRHSRNGEALTGSQETGGQSRGRVLNDDRSSRIKTFIERFCNKTDNNNTLDQVCKESQATPETVNRDIDYTRSLESKLTLDIDFHTAGHDNPSDDEAAIFALGANLYGNEVIPYIDYNTIKGFKEGRPMSGETQLMDARALNAKRSVAVNSFAAQVGMRAAGTGEAQPYLYKMVAELGVPEKDLETLLGKNPSYFAQMEVITKKIFQNPVFYTELYDKPANVDRKGVVLQAFGLMQDRDIYDALLRSEAVLSVLVDTMLQKEHDTLEEQIRLLNASSTTSVGNRGGR